MEPDQRSDIYSLGCCMFEALRGAPPFTGSSKFDTMSMQISLPPHLELTDMPEFAAIKTIILRCLEKSPEARFPSADALKLGRHLAYPQ